MGSWQLSAASLVHANEEANAVTCSAQPAQGFVFCSRTSALDGFEGKPNELQPPGNTR